MKTTKTSVTENTFGYSIEFEKQKLIFGRKKGALVDSLVADNVLLVAFETELCAVDFHGDILWKIPAYKSETGEILPWVGMSKISFDYDCSGEKNDCILYANMINHMCILHDIQTGKSVVFPIHR